jgi:hypothetical protein
LHSQNVPGKQIVVAWGLRIELHAKAKFKKGDPDLQQFEQSRGKPNVRSRWKFTCVLVVAVWLASAAFAQQVLTESGTVSEVSANGLSVYKGIPFAAPPVGDLRWRAPVRSAPWTGIRKADAFAPACMQVGVSMPGETPPAVSEDCLYLNIWTPAKAKITHEHLPVIVWIYGGGYINGSSSMPLYWGDRLAQKGAIVVTIAYRLGPLGFLALPELTRPAPPAACVGEIESCWVSCPTNSESADRHWMRCFGPECND